MNASAGRKVQWKIVIFLSVPEPDYPCGKDLDRFSRPQLMGRVLGIVYRAISAWEDGQDFAQVAKESGFSLHAGVAAQAWEPQKLERLSRYITRLAVTEKQLSLTPTGNIRIRCCRQGCIATSARFAYPATRAIPTSDWFV
jgi:hypothetical protein